MTAEQTRLLLHIRRVAAGLLFIAAVAGTYFARDFLLPAALAFFIATTLRPLVRNMSRRGIPAWATTAGIVIAASMLMGLAVFVLAGAFSQWMSEAPRLQQELLRKIGGLRDSFDELAHLSQTLQEATSPARDDAQEVVVKQPMLPTLFTIVAGYPLNIIFVASGAVVIAIFLMASGDLFYEKLIRVLPTLSDKKAALAIALDVEREVSAYLLSITLINAGLAVFVGLAFGLLGLPTPHLWALLAFVLNFIPYLGPIIGVVISALIGIIVFDTLWQALLAPLVYGLLIGLETQIVTPSVLSRRMEINAVMILLALAFWAWCWGIAGIVLAVPVLVTFRVLCAHVEALAPFGEFLAQKRAGEST